MRLGRARTLRLGAAARRGGSIAAIGHGACFGAAPLAGCLGMVEGAVGSDWARVQPRHSDVDEVRVHLLAPARAGRQLLSAA